MNQSIDRRSFLAGGAALALGACSRKKAPTATASSARPGGNLLGGTWKMESFPAGPDIPDGERAMILNPWPVKNKPRPAQRPLLIALHGRGESGPSDAGLLEEGANAWPETYELEEMNSRLFAPPLVPADLHRMTSPERLDKLNASLDKKHYEGLGVACPFTPLVRSPMEDGFGRFVAVDLVRRLRDLTGSRVGREGVGIDGVSMGGRLALFIGLMHPEVFGVVGALQPALQKDDAEQLSLLARAAREKAKVRIRLVSSDDDCFLGAVTAASDVLNRDGVWHELLIIPGSHGYEFNRGPGAAEMLLWHERVQRGLPSPGIEGPDGGVVELGAPPPKAP